jgi:hypothetical protein
VPAWAIGVLCTLGVAIVVHGVHDLIRFIEVKRDIRWMKAEMRKRGMVAPNGDDD